MKRFDANTWIGRWPFSFQPAHTARSLADELSAHGINSALVSPLDAVFQPEPTPANLALLRSTRTVPMLQPVPVVNPRLANWRDALHACAADPRVRAVRLLPSYHDYRLSDPAVREIIQATTDLGLRLIVGMRLIDERHEYFALRIKPVPTSELAALAARHRDVPILASGLLRTDIIKLLPAHPQLLADVSFAEWHETLANLIASVSAQQLVFASHTPFLITAAATAKLAAGPVASAERRRIAFANLTRFLGGH